MILGAKSRIVPSLLLLFNCSICFLYTQSLLKDHWFNATGTTNDGKNLIITKFGLWRACYSSTSSHGCDTSPRILQFRLQENALHIPHWTYVTQLTATLGVIFIGFSSLVAFNSVCDKTIYDSREMSFFVLGTFLIVFTQYYFGYRIRSLNLKNRKWVSSFVLNVIGIILSLLKIVVFLVLHVYQLVRQSQDTCQTKQFPWMLLGQCSSKKLKVF